MTTSTVTARRKGDPQYYVEGKMSKSIWDVTEVFFVLDLAHMLDEFV